MIVPKQEILEFSKRGQNLIKTRLCFVMKCFGVPKLRRSLFLLIKLSNLAPVLILLHRLAAIKNGKHSSPLILLISFIVLLFAWFCYK